MKRKRIIFISGISLILVIILLKACHKKGASVVPETVKTKIGTVSTNVTATGTIEATKTVAVGTRVSGEIRKIYVDFNSDVKAGQLLAELDQKPLKTALTLAETSLDKTKAEMTYQTSNYKRIKALYDKKLVAESDYDQALYNYETAQTSLKSAQLNYDKAKIDLSYAYIYSPIDGVVLNRAVDEGQTVAASFSTPTLFSIANDLTHMQVEASIDEADIGQVKVGQRVEFNVDAYPNDIFEGKVTQVRLEPVITSNVVTYTVIVEAPNPEKKLMPGMTANITIIVDEAKNVLTVASKALRFKPDPATLAMYMNSLPGKDRSKEKPERKPHKFHNRPDSAGIGMGNRGFNNDSIKKIWIKTGDIIHPVRVKTGIDNDINVQVLSGLKVGDEVVVGFKTEKNYTASNQQNGSPFMPRPPFRRSKKK